MFMQKNHIIYLFVGLVLANAVLLASCTGTSCPITTGANSTEIRSLPSFNTIVVQGKLHLILTQDSLQQVAVTTGKNFQKGISMNVNQETLTIHDNNRCVLQDPSEWTNVYISSGELKAITCYGSGDITSTNTLKADVFTVDCWYGTENIQLDMQANALYAIARHESATIRITGNADSAYIYCGEASAVDLSRFLTQAVAIDSKTIRDISVNVSRALHANIVYRGNVYYKGNPAVIDTLITDAGRLIHIP